MIVGVPSPEYNTCAVSSAPGIKPTAYGPVTPSLNASSERVAAGNKDEADIIRRTVMGLHQDHVGFAVWCTPKYCVRLTVVQRAKEVR